MTELVSLPLPAGKARRRLLWALSAAAGVGVLGGFGFYGWREQARQKGPETAFWQQRLEMLGGSSMEASEFRGRPLLLNFWATWCPPCVEEMPLINAFFIKNSKNGHQVLGIALDKADSVRSFLGRIPVQFPIAIAGFPGAELAKSLGNIGGGLPFSVFFASDGTIARRKMGRILDEDLRLWEKATS